MERATQKQHQTCQNVLHNLALSAPMIMNQFLKYISLFISLFGSLSIFFFFSSRERERSLLAVFLQRTKTNICFTFSVNCHCQNISFSVPETCLCRVSHFVSVYNISNNKYCISQSIEIIKISP